jgi:hypothetical protein
LIKSLTGSNFLRFLAQPGKSTLGNNSKMNEAIKTPEHQAVYKKLREAILLGHFAPGEPLTIQGLTSFLKAGITLVCEAMRCGRYGTTNLPDKHAELIDALMNQDSSSAAIAMREDLVVRFRHLAPIAPCPRPNVGIARTTRNDKFLVAFLNLTLVRRDCRIGDTNVKFTPREQGLELICQSIPQ